MTDASLLNLTIDFDGVITYECENDTRFGPDEILHKRFDMTCLSNGTYLASVDGTSIILDLVNDTYGGFDWPLCEDPTGKYYPRFFCFPIIKHNVS